jgi:hypothetical protein
VSRVSERISSAFGWVSLVSIAVSFLVVFGFAIYQLDFWQHYFFFDSTRIDSGCSVRVLRSSDIRTDTARLSAESPVVLPIPHAADALIKSARGEGDFYHAEYQCTIAPESLAIGKDGLSYLHVGWVIADHVDVFIDGRPVASFKGADKLSIPVAQRDELVKPINLAIRLKSYKPPYLGLCGKTPFVASVGNQQNNKVFGLEFALQQTRQLYGLLPALTLGVFLIVAWLLGLRSQLVVATMGFILMVILRNTVLLLSEFWTWNVFTSYQFSFAFQFGTIAFFLIFALELLGYAQRYVSYLMICGVVLVTLEIFASSVAAASQIKMLPLEQINYGFNLVGCTALLWIEKRQRSAFSPSRQKINSYFVYTVALLAALSLIDYVFIYLDIRIRLAHKVELILPLFVVGTVFYTISLIEREFREERSKRALMERDMELAREIQDSLSSPEDSIDFGPLKFECFQHKHQKVAGDWLAIRSSPDQNKVVVVVADATGKGMQAALVIHAIQSMWAEALDDDSFDATLWLRKVNRTLHRLGKRQAHSATLGILTVGLDNIEYLSAGHLPLFIAEQVDAASRPKVRSLNARGNVLGLNEDVSFEAVTFEFDPTHSYVLLLGTDGVFANATRTKPSEILTLLAGLQSNGRRYVESEGDDDDRTVVMLTKKADQLVKI